MGVGVVTTGRTLEAAAVALYDAAQGRGQQEPRVLLSGLELAGVFVDNIADLLRREFAQHGAQATLVPVPGVSNIHQFEQHLATFISLDNILNILYSISVE